MEERKLTEKESLEVITSMIARTRQRYIGDGNILMLWGYLVAGIAILVWVMLATTRQGYWNWLWFAIPLIGCPVTSVMARRQQRQSGFKTFTDKVTSQLWTIASVSEIILSIFCIMFQYVTGSECWSAMLVYTMIAIPFAEIAQGLFIKEKCLTIGGMIGIAVGIVTVCCVAGRIPLYANLYMPLFILAFVAMMIVPGHILNHKACKEK